MPRMLVFLGFVSYLGNDERGVVVVDDSDDDDDGDDDDDDDDDGVG